MDYLKPCPFCGTSDVKSSFNRDTSNLTINHNKPCILEDVSLQYWGGEENHQELIDDWNKRNFKNVNNISANVIHGDFNFNA
jgi:hypothetical protein